jgi:hypothetical protein
MKFLHLVGLVLTGLNVVVSGVTFERDVTAVNKFSVAAARHGAVSHNLHDLSCLLTWQSHSLVGCVALLRGGREAREVSQRHFLVHG